MDHQPNLPSKTNQWPVLKTTWFLVVLTALPLMILFNGFSPRYGFLHLIRFGDEFEAQRLDVIRGKTPVSNHSQAGYDGQFYAQIALDPSLNQEGLREACDSLAYRAKRIGLPTLAFLLGAGQPWWILQIYAILNFFFWLWLAVLLYKEFGCSTLESQLLLIGVLWTAGVLISVGRALTDLPALVLSIAALHFFRSQSSTSARRFSLKDFRYWLGCGLAACAVLTKETAILSVFRYVLPWRGERRRWLPNMILLVVAVLPMLMWSWYVTQKVGSDRIGLGNFDFPWSGFFGKVHQEWMTAITDFPRLPWLELIAPLSLLTQVVWMAAYGDSQSRWWWFGVGFVPLFMLVGHHVWATQSAYSRCLLPLTISFNVMLYQANLPTSRHRWWWVLGNLGLLDRAIPGLVVMTIARICAGWRSLSKTALTK
jgi:hypothetical protein